MDEADRVVRCFIFADFHEVAHAYLELRSRMFDGITPEENAAQETEADALARKWYNECVTIKGKPYLPELKFEEIERARANNQAEIEARYEGPNQRLQTDGDQP